MRSQHSAWCPLVVALGCLLPPTAGLAQAEPASSPSSVLIDQDLNSAQAKLLTGDKTSAITLASKWIEGSGSAEQHSRANKILKEATRFTPTDLVKLLLPGWLREILITIVTLALLQLLLLAARMLWREWKRGEWYGNLTRTTKWTMVPLKEYSTTPGEQTGLATDSVLDALARIGHELQQPVWKPHLLLLRPTPPANYEPAIITEFLSDTLDCIVMAPPADDLCLEWKLHDIRLDEAVQNLQLKASSGMDIGSVARVLAGVVQWFNAGAPEISGIARTVADKTVSLHLAARGGRIKAAAVTAPTAVAPGLDAMELSAERVAFKFLFRMRYPDMTNDQIDGFAALRQGAAQFAQYAGTVPGIGEDALARTSSLAKAALNFSFFRASIPTHCDAGRAQKERTSLKITDDVRQAALLAEGVSHTLVGTEEGIMPAIDCFRQVQDWPGSLQTQSLRQQAAYNEALVWAHDGRVARSVLMLTELLGEKAPDTEVAGDAALPVRHKKELDRAIRLPARLARAAALARYRRDVWPTVPECRIELIADDTKKLIQELDALCAESETSSHDHRLMRYLYVEALRAIGHIELMRVIHGGARGLYENKRPVGLRNKNLDQDSCKRLRHAISYMLTCEQLSPGADLYCDLAESYLLLKHFTTAEGYARHAILESQPASERACYIAVESFVLENTKNSLSLARKYASDFQGSVTLQEFEAVLAELGVSGPPPTQARAAGTS